MKGESNLTSEMFHGGNGRLPDPLFAQHTPLAMAYVPMQQLENVYEPAHALLRGTLYPELDKPWLPKEGGRTR